MQKLERAALCFIVSNKSEKFSLNSRSYRHHFSWGWTNKERTKSLRSWWTIQQIIVVEKKLQWSSTNKTYITLVLLTLKGIVVPCDRALCHYMHDISLNKHGCESPLHWCTEAYNHKTVILYISAVSHFPSGRQSSCTVEIVMRKVCYFSLCAFEISNGKLNKGLASLLS